MTGFYGQRIYEVYRLYNAADELLYIGKTHAIHQRLPQHSQPKGSQWWPEVAYCTLEQFPSDHTALVAERAAIRSELPRYNRRSSVLHA